MEGVAEGQVEGYEAVGGEGLAGCKVGFFRSGAESEDVVDGEEVREAVVLGWVGDLESAATKERYVGG